MACYAVERERAEPDKNGNKEKYFERVMTLLACSTLPNDDSESK